MVEGGACCRCGYRDGDRVGPRVCVLQRDCGLDHLLPVHVPPRHAALEHVRQLVEHGQLSRRRGER